MDYQKKLEVIRSDLDKYQSAMVEEAIWLFLAICGCWSVPHSWLRLFALIVAFALFFHKAKKHLAGSKSFSLQLDELESVGMRGDILALSEANRIRVEYLSWRTLTGRVWPYSICWLFASASFLCFFYYPY